MSAVGQQSIHHPTCSVGLCSPDIRVYTSNVAPMPTTAYQHAPTSPQAGVQACIIARLPTHRSASLQCHKAATDYKHFNKVLFSMQDIGEVTLIYWKKTGNNLNTANMTMKCYCLIYCHMYYLESIIAQIKDSLVSNFAVPNSQHV